MYKLTISLATLMLAGSAAAYAATSTAATMTTTPSQPAASRQAPVVYHEANTASPVASTSQWSASQQKVKASSQMAQQNARPQGQRSMEYPTMSETASVMHAGIDNGPRTLMGRLDAVKARIHLARTTGKLTGPEFSQLHADYSLVASDIERAHGRFGQEIPNQQLWSLNGQIRYLSSQAGKMIG